MLSKKDIEKLEQIRTALTKDKALYVSKWEQLSRFLGLSFSNWNSNSTPDNEVMTDTKAVYDSTAEEAGDLMANGIQGYACGSSTPWFDLSFEDDKLTNKGGILGTALDKIKEHLYKVFAKSAFYDASLAMTQCVNHLGTGILWMEEDPKRQQPIFKVLHPRDCLIAENNAGEVDTLMRDFWLTKENAVEYFGEDKLSHNIKNCKDPMQKFQFTCFTAPRNKYGIGDNVSGNKNFISVYWEKGCNDKTVKEIQYDVKPFAVWRYNKALFGGAWGVDSPGIKQLSNIKQVNALCEDRVRLSQLIADPPIKRTRGLKVNITPHGFTDLNEGQDFTLVQSAGNLQWTNEIIADLQKKIRTAYYADYFLILSATIEQRKTATEAQGLQEEKSVLMSSFFSRMGAEFFEPVIEWSFINELEHGRMQEVANQFINAGLTLSNIKIDFVSQLAKTQERATKFQPNVNYAMQIIQLMQVYPEAKFKLNIYKYLDSIAKNFGTNKDIVVNSTEAERQYAKQIQAQAEIAQKQQELANNEQQAKILNDIAGASRQLQG